MSAGRAGVGGRARRFLPVPGEPGPSAGRGGQKGGLEPGRSAGGAGPSAPSGGGSAWAVEAAFGLSGAPAEKSIVWPCPPGRWGCRSGRPCPEAASSLAKPARTSPCSSTRIQTGCGWKTPPLIKCSAWDACYVCSHFSRIGSNSCGDEVILSPC